MKRILMVLFAIATSLTVSSGADYCWTNLAGSLTANGDADGGPGTSLFTQTYGIDINGAGDTLIVADRSTGKIKKIALPGGLVTTLGTYGSPRELVVDKVDGTIYFPDPGLLTINRLTYPGLVLTTIATGISALGLGVDSTSHAVYVSGQTLANAHAIFVITNAAGATPGPLTRIAGLAGTAGFVDGTLDDARFNSPMGIAVVNSGGNITLYVGDRDNDAIRKIDIAGNAVTTVAGHHGRACADGTGGIGGTAQFEAPHGCFMGPDGNLYVPEQNGFTVRKVTLPAGDVTTIGGLCLTSGAANGCGTNALFGNIAELTMDSAGNIYTCERGSVASSFSRVSKGTPPAVASCNVQIDFTAGATDTAGQFTLQRSSPDVSGTYADVAATMTTLGAGSFRAVIACGAAPEFYRIKR